MPIRDEYNKSENRKSSQTAEKIAKVLSLNIHRKSPIIKGYFQLIGLQESNFIKNTALPDGHICRPQSILTWTNEPHLTLYKKSWIYVLLTTIDGKDAMAINVHLNNYRHMRNQQFETIDQIV